MHANVYIDLFLGYFDIYSAHCKLRNCIVNATVMYRSYYVAISSRHETLTRDVNASTQFSLRKTIGLEVGQRWSMKIDRLDLDRSVIVN